MPLAPSKAKTPPPWVPPEMRLVPSSRTFIICSSQTKVFMPGMSAAQRRSPVDLFRAMTWPSLPARPPGGWQPAFQSGQAERPGEGRSAAKSSVPSASKTMPADPQEQKSQVVHRVVPSAAKAETHQSSAAT